MRRGTTPTITLTVDADVHDWTMYVTFANGGNQVTFEDDRLVKTLDGPQTKVEFVLSQEETLALSVGTVEVQIRAIKDGVALATDIQRLPIDRIIKEGVIDE